MIYNIYARAFQKGLYIATFFMPWHEPEAISGEGSLVKLPKFLKDKKLGSALIVTDKMLVSLGMIQPLVDEMKVQGIDFVVFDEVVPNPTIDNIEDGLKIYHANKCDHIIAFGGGSPMDCAKGIGARVARPKKSIPQMKGLLKILRKLPPIVAIPTTSGTGSEATLAAVITNSETHEKYALNDISLIPKYAVMDPLLTKGLPKHITSTTGMDALTHAVEAYIGKGNTKKTKANAIEATQLIFKYLKRAYDNGEDLEARGKMQRASYLAGMAFTRAYVGYVHAVAHTLGGFYSVPHGLANSVILPYVLEMFGESAHKKLACLADAVGIKGKDDEEKATLFIKAIREMNKDMDIPERIENTIKDEDIPVMVKRAIAEAHPLYPVPRFFTKAEIEDVFNRIK